MKIPTPTGWTTMENIKVGDTVFDENGEPCAVTFVSEIQLNRPCFDIEFDDHTVITADADHEWLTWTHAARKAAARRIKDASPRHSRPQSTPHIFPETRRTVDILTTLTHGMRGDINHSIQVAKPILTKGVELPIGPYTLGAWLGDGDSKDAVITGADPAILDEIRHEGYTVADGKADPRSRALRYRVSTTPANGKLLTDLKTLGVFRNKHIPTLYLRSSVHQRAALLCGLMDTDGSVTRGGHCEFMTTRAQLSTDVFELVSSLGIKAVIREERATLQGRDVGPRYRITFTPHFPVFRIPRKVERQHFGKSQVGRTHHRYIVDVRPVPSVPVRCIQVDSPSHLFLISESFIPTHNTRTIAETGRAWVENGVCGRIAIVAPTNFDARVTMVEGDSGILAVCPPWNKPTYHPSKSEVHWPNGAIATLFSSEEPDRLNGPQFDGALLDELGVWSNPKHTYDMLSFGLRLGKQPRKLIATTPKPNAEARAILYDLLADPETVVTRGSTYENEANLAASYIKTVVKQYEGTRLGREQLHAEMIEETEGALWTAATMIDPYRVKPEAVPDLVRVVVGVDPMTKVLTDDEREKAKRTGKVPSGAETGIIVAGADGRDPPHAYVLADYSVSGSPDEWGRAVVRAYEQYHADRVVAEINQGGAMVEATLRTIAPTISYKAVHAHQGKYTRAEPVAAIYEQKRGHHVGVHAALEDEMCNWVQGSVSPNRLDAAVWAIHDLLIEGVRPKPQILY